MLAALYGLAVAASPAVSFVDELDVAPKLKPRQMLAITTCPACTDYQDGESLAPRPPPSSCPLPSTLRPRPARC